MIAPTHIALRSPTLITDYPKKVCENKTGYIFIIIIVTIIIIIFCQTDVWILTNGYAEGVTKCVGEAVRSYKSRSDGTKTITTIGMPRLDMVKSQEQEVLTFIFYIVGKTK